MDVKIAMVYILQVVIRIIDLTPMFMTIGVIILTIWSLIIMYILGGREKKEMEYLKSRILNGEEKPFLNMLKKIGYAFLILTVISYLVGIIILAEN